MAYFMSGPEDNEVLDEDECDDCGQPLDECECGETDEDED